MSWHTVVELLVVRLALLTALVVVLSVVLGACAVEVAGKRFDLSFKQQDLASDPQQWPVLTPPAEPQPLISRAKQPSRW